MINFEKAFQELDKLLENGEVTNVLRCDIEEALIDESLLRRGRDWSEIGSEVV